MNGLVDTSGILGIIATALFQGTVLSLLTWISCATIFRNSRPALQSALWTIVLLKFLLPPVSLGAPSLNGILQSLGFLSFLEVRGWTKAVESAIPVESWSSAVSNPTASVVSHGFSIPALWGTLVLVVYGISLLGISLRSTGTAMKTWRMIRSLPEADPTFQCRVRRLARRLQLRRTPRVLVMNRSLSPFVMGLLRPRLIVPPGLFSQLDEPVGDALILHELAHIRRGDLLVRWVQNIARLLLFFWPPVRWVCRRIEQSAEMACDQWAVRLSRVAPHSYARSLLDVVKNMSMTPIAQRELAFARKGSQLEERFDMILKKDATLTPKLNWLMFPGIAIWAVFALSGGTLTASEEGAGTEKKEIHIRTSKDPGELVLELGEFPEADLDGDGQLTLAELQTYADAYPEEVMVTVERIDEPGDIIQVEIRKTVSSAGEATVELPEGEPGDVDVLVLSKEDLSEHLNSVLEEHPEADLDGDGSLSLEELSSWMKSQDGKQSVFVVKEELHGDHEAEAVERHIVAEVENEGPKQIHIIKVGPGGEQSMGEIEHEEEVVHKIGEHGNSETLVWVDEGGKPSKVIIHKKRNADLDGDGTVTEEEAREAAEKQAQERRQRFLETHPEADRDGDGVISKEEATALAARMREAKTKAAKKEKQ